MKGGKEQESFLRGGLAWLIDTATALEFLIQQQWQP